MVDLFKNKQNLDLYNRIQEFSLDDLSSELLFSQRLAKDNNWSLDYTKRAIEEYKKFTFLAVVAGHPVSPSDQVDQVWHLHLCYTRSYWQEFCPNVLQTSLHHEPTRGGSSEQLKICDWYSKTLESYEQFFGYPPPIDIWPTLQDRFGRDLNFVRINSQQNWILHKPNFEIIFKPQKKQIISFYLLLFFSFVATSCQAISQLPNPIDFTGIDFLKLYIPLSIIGIISAYWWRYSLCLPDKQQHECSNLNTYEIAYLLDGNYRMIVAAITSLIKKKHVRIVEDKAYLALGEKPKRKLVSERTLDDITDSIEKSVAEVISMTDGSIEQILSKTTTLGDKIASRLQYIGLLLSDEQAFKAQIYPLLILAILLVLGVWKLFVGISRDKPVDFLLMCIFGILFSAFLFLVKPRLSHFGNRFLKNLIACSQDLKMPKSSQIALSVALFGIDMLTVDHTLRYFHQMLIVPTSHGSNGAGYGAGGWGGGSGCSGGGSGGGWGGCGGCGGGGGGG